MSTAAQLLRTIAELVDAGAPRPDSITFSHTGVVEILFDSFAADGSWTAYVKFFDGVPQAPRYHGKGSSDPFTARPWTRDFNGLPVEIVVYRRGDARTEGEILAAAAAHVRAHGHVQHDYTDETGACCINGAIQYVVSGDATNVEAGQSAKKLFAESLGLFDAQDADGVTVEDLIGRWNDEDGRTTDQAVLALLEVADQERTAEKHPVVAR
ncbi:hypothetical protein [Cryptosporangium sp. NPDC051539]|uniref:DUF6197 family protein n=1 Tax=Cryptosporangium sp. NPDC051539 TaxID=3363962 RepID=UPI0037A3E9CB